MMVRISKSTVEYSDTSSRNLPGRIITSGIIEDAHERLWFFTDKHLTVFNKKEEGFIQPGALNPEIRNLQETSKLLGFVDGKCWLFHQSGFIVLDPANWSFQFISGATGRIYSAVMADSICWFYEVVLMYTSKTAITLKFK